MHECSSGGDPECTIFTGRMEESTGRLEKIRFRCCRALPALGGPAGVPESDELDGSRDHEDIDRRIYAGTSGTSRGSLLPGVQVFV
jgi:hypothetical protein